MTLHWTEKAHAIASIGAELKQRGWTIFGYDPGESKPEVDYFRAPHWDGVAIHPQHPGIVVGVHVASGTVQYNSGQKDWPTFHTTPNRRAWHVEYHGQVVATGVGLEACASSSTEGHRAVTRLVNEIEAAVTNCRSNGSTTSAPAISDANGIRVQNERDWTWIFFPDTPSEAIREALRSNFGATFSKRRIGWYITRHVEPDEVMSVIKNADKTAPTVEPIPATSQPEEDEAGPYGFVAGKGSAYDYIPAWMKVPKLYASENAKEVPLATIKLFNPDGAWTYYILEWDGQDVIFGLVAGIGYETEFGYQSLAEVKDVRSAQLHLQMERDLWFKPTPVTEVGEYKEAWGEGGPYNRLPLPADYVKKADPAPAPASVAEPILDVLANGDDNGDEWHQRAQHFAALRRRNLSLEQYIIPMGQVEGLPFTTNDDSRIQVYCMGRDVLLQNGEVVTIAGFHTISAWPLIEALQPGGNLLPSDFSYQFDDGAARQIWSGYVQGVLFDEQQLKDLAQNIPQLSGMAQPWPLFPLDIGKDRWVKEDIEFLAELIEGDEDGVILVDRMTLGVWSIQDFAGMGEVVDGQQIVKTDHYTIRFDVGDYMSSTPSGEHRWTRVDLLDGRFPYDGAATAARLRALLAHPTQPTTPPQPDAQNTATSLPDGWTVDDIRCLLDALEKGPIVISCSKLGIPTIHDHEQFGAKVEHLGFGFFQGKGDGFTISFDGGGEMHRTPSGQGWSPLRIDGADKCPYKYDLDGVRQKLQSYLPATPAPQPAAIAKPAPEPAKPAEPWEISRTSYMMSKASFAGGMPIMNAADGEEHKRLVQEALSAGKPVPAYVMEDYPDLAPVILTFGDNGTQVYFENDQYRVMNPYRDQDGQRFGNGWVFFYRLQQEGGWTIYTYGPEDNQIIGGYSLKDVLQRAGDMLRCCFVPSGAPDSFPDEFPRIQKKADEQPPAPTFKKQLTGDAAQDLLKMAASIVPEMSGVGDDPVMPSPAKQISSLDQRLAKDAPLGQRKVETSAPAAQANPGPENEAELKEYELEIMTGRVDKRPSAFYNTIARVQPGTLLLALQRIPTGDTRRRQEIERRLGAGA